MLHKTSKNSKVTGGTKLSTNLKAVNSYTMPKWVLSSNANVEIKVVDAST